MKWFRFIMLIQIIISLSCHKVSCQSSEKLDSLLSLLKTMPDDTNKVNAFSSVFKTYMAKRKENNEFKEYADSVRILSEALNYDKGIAVAHYHYGRIDQYDGNFLKSINHLNHYLNYTEKEKDSFGMANALFELGNTYWNMGEYDNRQTLNSKILNP